MIVQDDMWKGIPLIHVFNETMDENTPVVIFLHGFLSAKEHNLHYAYQLVKKGVRVILPDALYHGDRSTDEDESKLRLQFWNIVLKSIQEVGILYEELHLRKLVGNNKIAVAGTSMGAIVSSGCLKQYDWISSSALCMGSPAYNELATYQLNHYEQSGTMEITNEQKEQLHTLLSHYDISTNLEAFNNRPILFWHGKKDIMVPFELTYNFYEKLKPFYENTPERLTFIVENHAGHKVNRNGVIAVTDWLANHLDAREHL